MRVKNIKIIIGFSTLLAMPILILSLSTFSTKKIATSKNPNVIIISIDSLSSEHLGTYGYERETTPNIDELAEKSTVYENSFSPISFTISSFASLFTGLYPTKHQDYLDNLDEKYPTLAEILKKNNYNTAGFISSNILGAERTNLNRGFDEYDEIDDEDKSAQKSSNINWSDNPGYDIQGAQRTTDEALAWLSKNKDKSFLLFAHYFNPHSFYLPPEQFSDKFSKDFPAGIKDKLNNESGQRTVFNDKVPLSETEVEYLKAKYDEEIAYTDYCIGKFLERIESERLYENTIIIITADHGESFDHDYLEHGHRIYDSTIKIPLIIYDPQVAEGKRENKVVSLIDIMPTIMSRLNIETDINFDGIDINKQENIANRDNIYSISLPPIRYIENNQLPIRKTEYIGQLYANITENERLIYNESSGHKEFYKINNDPQQAYNLYGIDQRSYQLFDNLILWLSKSNFTETDIKIKDKELYDLLKSLGYL